MSDLTQAGDENLGSAVAPNDSRSAYAEHRRAERHRLERWAFTGVSLVVLAAVGTSVLVGLGIAVGLLLQHFLAPHDNPVFFAFVGAAVALVGGLWLVARFGDRGKWRAESFNPITAGRRADSAPTFEEATETRDD